MAYFLGVTGTHSTGKSTFLEGIEAKAAANGIVVAKVGDIATKCKGIGFPILLDHTFESTLWIIVAVIKSELEAEMHADLVLVDRPVPDALGYLEAALKATKRDISSEQRSYLYSLVKEHSSRYHLLFKTSLDESIPVGEGRDPNMNFRRDAGLEIDKVLKNIKVPFMDPGTQAARESVEGIIKLIMAENNSRSAG